MRALLFLLAACGRFDFEPRTDGALPPAGPRLKLQYNAFDDGTREVIGAYDTQLQTACTATAMATTAGYGCLPIGSFVYFSDAACTQPVMQVSDCNPDTRYAYDPFVFPVAHVYTPGADIGLPAMLFQRGAEGACIASGTPTGAYKALTDHCPRCSSRTTRVRRVGAASTSTMRARNIRARSTRARPRRATRSRRAGTCIESEQKSHRRCSRR